jgi:hypothetical protein
MQIEIADGQNGTDQNDADHHEDIGVTRSGDGDKAR